MKLKFIISLLYVSVFLSCEEQDNTYQGPPVVEWQKSFNGSSRTYTKTTPGQVVRETLRIQLVGRQSSNPIDVTFEIDDSSTAEDGIHFNLVSATTVSIPANSSFVDVEFDVILDGFTNSRNLVLEIVDADVGLNANYTKVTHRMTVQ